MPGAAELEEWYPRKVAVLRDLGTICNETQRVCVHLKNDEISECFDSEMGLFRQISTEKPINKDKIIQSRFFGRHQVNGTARATVPAPTFTGSQSLDVAKGEQAVD
jgi:hypothetical protein